ncbi:MAG: hypothetical protein M4D80_35825 [Myxococcota bacterium]|nr:hypothetical protein [Deltaproteobacteria bacterium]MDQ3340558.1 hypothetical protein [Myxococcota bacterium]
MDLLLESLTRLRDTWPSPPWSWDARFATIAASFTIDLEPAVRQSAQLAFPRGWTSKSLENAPEEFRALAVRTGLRANQRLLGGDVTFASKLFGLWWPWGGGDKITLRIGVLDADAATEPVPSIRALFDVKG